MNNKYVLIRVDDRLIHGQVMTGWVTTTWASNIIVIDDALSEDDFMQNVFKMSLPDGLDLSVYSVNDAVDVLNDPSESRNTIVIVKTILTIKELILKGVDIRTINIGGMGAKVGRDPIYKNLAASPEEVKAIKDMIEEGRTVYFQTLPEQPKIDMKKLI